MVDYEILKKERDEGSLRYLGSSPPTLSTHPKPSMYGIFTSMDGRFFMVKVGKDDSAMDAMGEL